MQKTLIRLAFAVLLTVPLAAQQYVTVADVTVAGTAVTVFTASDIQQGNGHPQAVAASCALTGGNIRVTFDGTTPTSSLGQVLLIGGPYQIAPTANLLNMQAIRDDSTSGVLSCTLVR